MLFMRPEIEKVLDSQKFVNEIKISGAVSMDENATWNNK